MAKRRLAMVAAVAAAVGVLSPAVAHAAMTRSASGNAWGHDRAAAEANAKVVALNALNALGRSFGETCTGVSYDTYLIYIVPSGGGYQFGATATGSCA